MAVQRPIDVVIIEDTECKRRISYDDWKSLGSYLMEDLNKGRYLSITAEHDNGDVTVLTPP